MSTAEGVLLHPQDSYSYGAMQSQGTSKGKSWRLFTPGWMCGCPHLGRRWLDTSCNCPASPLTPPNLIEALSMFEPLSYCPGYLVASTNAIIPTFQVPLSPITFLIRYSKLRMLFQKKKNLECPNVHEGVLLFTGQELESDFGFHRLSQPVPTAPAFLSSPSISLHPRLLCRNLSNFTVNDKNHEVYPATSGESLELSCLLLIISLRIQIFKFIFVFCRFARTSTIFCLTLMYSEKRF